MPVYFIQAGKGGPIKIGFSEDVRLRQVKMQADNHERLYLLGVKDGGRKDEADFHQRFYDNHLSGEWFRPSVDLLGCINGNVPNVDVSVESSEKSEGLRHDRVITLLGGGTKLAIALAADMNRPVDRETVYSWTKRGKIPAKYWPAVARLARRRRISGVTVQWLEGAL